MGKKLYKTSMLFVFKLIILAVVVFFLNTFYLETFANPKFDVDRGRAIMDIINFHYRYPEDFIRFFCIIIIPAIYYAFFRGIAFHDKGFVYNRGLPFMNRSVCYSNVERYKLLHPKLALSIHCKNGDVFLVADNDIERVIAILDQQNIRGDLAPDEFVRMITNYRKMLMIILSVLAVLFVLRKIFFN
jgi:hypothetical protein